jgi:hypothetical protein
VTSSSNWKYEPAGRDPITRDPLRVIDLLNRGSEILGGDNHNAVRAERWREWFNLLTPDQRNLYKRHRGRRARKSN